jgi:glycosyltransferase involved in cell wall biosynthesis
MRVMQLTTDLRFAGAERVIVSLARGLRGRGVECAVAGLFRGGEPSGRTSALLREAGFPVYCARMERKWMLWRAVGLRRFIVGWQPDVLHCHMFHANAASVFLRATGLACPVLWTYHNVEHRSLPLRRAFYRLGRPLADRQVYVSGAVRDHQHGVAGTGRREAVIYNGLDPTRFLDIAPRPGPVFGSVGRLVPQKGYDLLVRAFARLCRHDDEAQLKIAGDGPTRSDLLRLIRSLGVSGRAELAGFVEDVPGFLSGLNAFVVPSRTEGFGMTLLEALAAGLPCIASRVGALPEIGRRVVTWVEPEDVEGLHRAMGALKREAWSPKAIARRRRRAKTFTVPRMVARYLSLYRSLAGVG